MIQTIFLQLYIEVMIKPKGEENKFAVTGKSLEFGLVP